MKRKLKLNGEELEFMMTNKTIIEIDEKSGNFGQVINGVMYGEKLYTNSIIIVANSCITRELKEEELIEKLTPNQMTKEIVPFATELYLDYMGVKPSTEQSKKGKQPKKK